MKEMAYGLNKVMTSRALALVKRLAPDMTNLSVAMSGGVTRNGKGKIT